MLGGDTALQAGLLQHSLLSVSTRAPDSGGHENLLWVKNNHQRPALRQADDGRNSGGRGMEIRSFKNSLGDSKMSPGLITAELEI